MLQVVEARRVQEEHPQNSFLFRDSLNQMINPRRKYQQMSIGIQVLLLWNKIEWKSYTIINEIVK